MDAARSETTSRSSDIVFLNATCLPASGESLVRSSSDIIFSISICKLLRQCIAFLIGSSSSNTLT
eukprot:IDg23229t1